MPAWLSQFLRQNGLTLVLFGLFAYYVYTHDNGGAPIPEPAVTVAARGYLKALPRSYESVKQGVLAGNIKNKMELINAANVGAAEPMANAFDAAISQGIDPKTGTITSPPVVAQAIDDLVKGLTQ